MLIRPKLLPPGSTQFDPRTGLLDLFFSSTPPTLPVTVAADADAGRAYHLFEIWSDWLGVRVGFAPIGLGSGTGVWSDWLGVRVGFAPIG